MRRVLDIGHGGYPLGNPLNSELAAFARKLPPGIEYHGIDIPYGGRRSSHMAGDRIKAEDITHLEKSLTADMMGRIFLYRMDARRLSFPASHFDEVHMHNFITDPRLSQQDVAEAIREARRVLSAGGVCFISGESEGNSRAKWVMADDTLRELGFSYVHDVPLAKLTPLHEDVSLGYGFRFGIAVAAMRNQEAG